MKRLLPLATLVALLVPAAAAPAQGSGLNIHAIFEGGKTAGFRVGEPLQVSYRKGKVRSTRVCWSPGPIDRPACSRTAAAPSRAGVQRFVLTLSNGHKIRTSRRIAAAASSLPSRIPSGPSAPVPFTASCAAEVFGNFAMNDPNDPIATLDAGDHAAAYYRTGTILQVYVYRTGQPGFAQQDCLQPGLS